jgi:hypothetical protein
MKVTVTPDPRTGRSRRLFVALPIAVGSAVIAVVRVGVLATLLAVLIGVPLVALLTRAAAKWGRRRVERRGSQPRLLLGAEATVHGKAGALRLFPDLLRWERRGGRDPMVLRTAEIDEVSLVPVNSIFVRAARLTITMVDGREVKITVTAPSEEVEAALRSAG